MDQVFTFGIAGHVDHGKTTLVRALTGIETDRLAEEKRRGISIELGFAWLDLPLPDGSQARVGLVDMPGHERFVRRMISGAAAIDAVLLVVAADEGVMPQGREHLAICDLLGVSAGAVVLTKLDLADELLEELVIDDIAGLAEGTFLASSPTLRFSSREPERWLPELRANLGQLVSQLLQSSDGQLAAARRRPFRMAVDRSFTLRGRGTIATGTAATGRVETDDQVQVYPGSSHFRIRSIERHGSSVDHFEAPGRLALNVAGASLDDVAVGQVLAAPGSLFATSRFDARLRLLGYGDRGMSRRQRALIHVGTAHAEGAITQLAGEPLAAGKAGWVQIHLDRPLALAAGEFFVVRGSQVDPRFGQTLAGGQVLHPSPARHHLNDAAVLSDLEALGGPDVEARLAALVRLAGIRGETGSELARLERGAPVAIEKAIVRAIARGRLRRFGNPQPRYYAPEAVAWLEERALAEVAAAHVSHPERDGIETDELIRRVGDWLDPRALGHLIERIVRRGDLVARDRALASPGFEPRRETARDEVHVAILTALRRSDLAAPKPAELLAGLAVDGVTAQELELALKAAVKAGDLERIASWFYLPSERVHSLVSSLLDRFGDAGGFSTSDLKDFLGLTRKHLIPLAEYLDGQRVTVRDPDGNRRFRSHALAGRSKGSDGGD